MCKEKLNILELPRYQRGMMCYVNPNSTEFGGRSQLPIHGCICNRDIDVSEFIRMIRYLQEKQKLGGPDREKFLDSAPISSYTIPFPSLGSTTMPLPGGLKVDSGKMDSEGNKCKLEIFVQALNLMFTRYGITTCKRKIHTLAQLYHESLHFRHTIEEDKERCKRYDGGRYFRGRGLIQITGKYNYLKYYDYINRTSYLKFHKVCESKPFYKDFKELFVPKLATDLYYVLDSAGWFLAIHLPSLKDKAVLPIMDEGFGDAVVKKVTHKINGGERELSLRQDYTRWLTEFFEYEKLCVNK